MESKAAVMQEGQESSSLSPQSSALSPLFRLTLDADGIYFGATEVHPDDVRDGDVVLDHAPDNAHGRYRWDRATSAFEPLPVSQRKDTPGTPSFEDALDALCHWLSDGDELPLPAPVAAWRAAYRRSIDRKKSID